VTDVTVIDPRFRGPPKSANGGYACGVLAEHIDGAAVATLRMPPPLGEEMVLERTETSSRLSLGGRLVGEATASAFHLTTPEVPTVVAAARGAKDYTGLTEHPFPGCFVCGPERGEGDGLRIFAGPVAGSGLVAAPWEPDPSLGDEDGLVSGRYLWAALDCPSYFAFSSAPKALLGRLTARLDRRPRVEEQLVAFAWKMSREGRKWRSASALATAEGELVAVAEAVWVEVEELPV